MLGWNRDAHMHMVWHQVPFDDAALFLTSKLMKDCAKLLANVPKDCLTATFGNEYEMLLAIPFGMGQALE